MVAHIILHLLPLYFIDINMIDICSVGIHSESFPTFFSRHVQSLAVPLVKNISVTSLLINFTLSLFILQITK